MNTTIFLDESGDLGFSFGMPYRSGGSSRYLTIGSLCVPSAIKYAPKRLVRDLYDKFGWNTAEEKKWADMSAHARAEFAKRAKDLCAEYPDISLHAITVKKQNVEAQFRSDTNKLYNYMIRLSLLDFMAGHDLVTFVPDPRTIKVETGKNLSEYLQKELSTTAGVKTALNTIPRDSAHSIGIQFADMLAGLVQSHYEDTEHGNFVTLSPYIKLTRLFFTP